MPRHTSPLLRRLAPARRASATAGLTAAALLVGVGGYSLATSAALSDAPGDRIAVADLLGGSDSGDVTASDGFDPAAARADEGEQASRSQRTPLTPGLPSTAAEAQDWLDEVDQLETTLADVAAAEEAARLAAEQEAARAAAEEAARAERRAAEAAAPGGDPSSNRAIGRAVLSSHGFGADQWSCLDKLWQKESGWSHTADNPTSSAYGIPQSLPGSKMSSAGPDWETNPETQIRWGLGYIQGRYGTPCSAWAHSQANNWY